jgi:tetratricopeptide (TPR) repeat protein
MHWFIWKGIDPAGTPGSDRVPAENAQAAKVEMIRRGWTDLQLVSDELGDLVRKRVETPFERQDEGSVEDYVRRIEEKAPGFLARWWDSTADIRLYALIILAFVVYGIYRGRIWPVILGFAGLAYLIFLYPVLHAFFSLPSRYFARLNLAKTCSRWDEVLLCVERLRRVRNLTKIGVGEIELARNRAMALAALGRLDEALAEFSQFKNSPETPNWLYLSFQAGIYDRAKAYDKALACRQQAVAEKPDNAAVWDDLALNYVHGLNRPQDAREALSRAEALEHTPIGRAFVPLVKGMICWREGKHSEAKQHLEEALAGFEPLAHRPLMPGLILFAKSYLCAVESALGNTAAARNLFSQTEQYLSAAKEEELLNACRNGLAIQ